MQLNPLGSTRPPASGQVKVAVPVPKYPAGHDRVQLAPETRPPSHAVELTEGWMLLPITEQVSEMQKGKECVR